MSKSEVPLESAAFIALLLSLAVLRFVNIRPRKHVVPEQGQDHFQCDSRGSFLVVLRGQYVGDYRAIDLDLHRVLRTTEKLLDLQVLLHPLEEQFNVPTFLVEGSNLACRAFFVVSHQHYRRIFLWPSYDYSSQRLAIVGVL